MKIVNPAFQSIISNEAWISINANINMESQSVFDYLAIHFPEELVKLIASNKLEKSALLDVSCSVCHIKDDTLARSILIPLLKDDDPCVRIQAIYDLRYRLDKHIIDILYELRNTDNDLNVVTMANDVLIAYAYY